MTDLLEIEKELEIITNVKINVQELWLMINTSEINVATIPVLLNTLMHAVKLFNIPNHSKKTLVVELLSLAIDQHVHDTTVATSLQMLLPTLVDTFVDIANSKQNYKKKIRSCCM
jgi:hypothetical protein